MYFRPKSPTQFNNEGFKTNIQLKRSTLDAQCSVPVFLFFDIRQILNHSHSVFTSRSLASRENVKIFSTPEEFLKLPFDKIYHDSPIAENEKKEIIGYRHAEILFPDQLEIEPFLKRIVVRSPAEKETLLSLMDEEVRQKYLRIIQIDTTNTVFFNRWTNFITVQLFSDGFKADLNVSTEKDNEYNPVKMDITFELKENDRWSSYTISNWIATQKLDYSFQTSRNEYELRIKFDDQLMYYGKYSHMDESPF